MALDPTTQIGPYRIVETLGEGGMGVVYLAEQLTPVHRMVALKLLKSGTDAHQVLARFEAERQALAVMDHPSIAKIFDAGLSDAGESYFVMELVTGRELAEYCDAERLTVRERLRLFVAVCQAVQHAHQKGVIHRDLKPSNVLVSNVDGQPLPRIIDFGIAKATRGGAFAGPDLTTDDQVMGTPAYMSPEQIDGSSDLDTRTDVYSLGVLLFEILVGALPYERSAYRGWAAVAAQLQREPPTLVRRFTELADTQETICELRSATPGQLRRELSGDLGWIVARAMEKDRERRYETVSAMAHDVQCHLNHEPVSARGAGTSYRLKKFVRRHRLGVTFGSTIALGLVGFSIVTAIQADRVARARDEADARRGQAEGLIDFMLSDLRDKLEPIGQLGILDDVGAQAIRYFSSIPEDQFSDEELASRSQALYQVGSVRLEQGDSEAAVEAFAESLRLARALAERAPDDVDRLFGLSQSHFYVGYASYLAEDFAAAESEFLGYLAAAGRLVDLDPENLDYRLEVGFAHSSLGSVREARGDLEGAADAYARTLEAQQVLVDQDPSNIDWIGELAESHNKLGVVLRKNGDYAGSLRQHTRELELKRSILEIAPDHAYWRLRSALALGFLAGVRLATGDFTESLALRDLQASALDSLVAYDPGNTNWRRNRAVVQLHRATVLLALGRSADAGSGLERAERELTELLRVDSAAFGWDIDLSLVHAARATLLSRSSQPEAALTAATEAVTLVQDASGSSAARARAVASARLARGYALEALDRPEEARLEWEQSLATIEPFEGGTERGEFRPLRVEALLLLGRSTEARAEWEILRSSGYVAPHLDALWDR